VNTVYLAKVLLDVELYLRGGEISQTKAKAIDLICLEKRGTLSGEKGVIHQPVYNRQKLQVVINIDRNLLGRKSQKGRVPKDHDVVLFQGKGPSLITCWKRGLLEIASLLEGGDCGGNRRKRVVPRRRGAVELPGNHRSGAAARGWLYQRVVIPKTQNGGNKSLEIPMPEGRTFDRKKKKHLSMEKGGGDCFKKATGAFRQGGGQSSTLFIKRGQTEK